VGYFGNPLPVLLMVAVAMFVHALTRNYSMLLEGLLAFGAIVLFVGAIVLFWPRNSEDDW
jgi:hypothetical protein